MTFEAVTRLQTSPANSVVDVRDDESAHTHRSLFEKQQFLSI
jgi:hypothetical protein